MKKLMYILPIFVILISSCSTAQKASEVQSIKVSVAPYIKMSCKELSTEQNSLVTKAQSIGAQVDSERQSDKNKELAAWILFAPAALMMDGNAESASQLASVKGQLEAVSDAMKVNDCVN
jgi:hypothetical protein|tara:strand:- start:304 stop:663 length:360 start_codon:yes stop_codon:yes gene_type:complete